MAFFDYIIIDKNSRVPKYRQVVESIIKNIAIGNLKIDQRIPSINMFSEEFYLSRDTVEKAYNILKERKIISSIRGKGYYITQTKLISKINVLFLINKLSSYKMRIYNSFISTIGGNAHTDLHIYHCDESLFLDIFEKNFGGYDYYIIMPHFKTANMKHVSSSDKILQAIKRIQKEKLIIVDNHLGSLEGVKIEIYQDFEKDIYYALESGLSKISKYYKIILAYPENTVYPYPKEVLHGFKKFCLHYELDFEILDEIYDDMVIGTNELFITIEESDLVKLVKLLRDRGLKMGKTIGVISYNDTPLKELLGITVISTDFLAMGKTTAEMILNNEKGIVKNPFNFIDRNSI